MAVAVKDSILQSTKKLVGMTEDYDAFDLDIITHINTAFSTLYQAGVGPLEGFFIEDEDDTWAQFLGNKMHINDVKTYVYMRVKMIFDPPTSSFGLDNFKEQINELIWRLNVADDFTVVSTPFVPGPVPEPEPEFGVTDVSFVHIQTNPSSIWEFNHPLSYEPNVTITDSAGTTVLTEVSYPTPNSVRSISAYAFSGTAKLS